MSKAKSVERLAVTVHLTGNRNARVSADVVADPGSAKPEKVLPVEAPTPAGVSDPSYRGTQWWPKRNRDEAPQTLSPTRASPPRSRDRANLNRNVTSESDLACL